MNTLFLCIIGLAVVLAAPATSIDSFVAPKTTTLPDNSTKYVRHVHRATLNFACEIERITVTPNFDSLPAGMEEPLTQIELEDHIGEPNSIEWAHVMQMYFSTIDSRGQERQLGTLGGDLGEFLIVLASIEEQTGKQFTPEETLKSFKSYLTVMSREKFYFAVDAEAIGAFKTACGCPQLNIADPPDAKKALLLNASHTAAANGDELFSKILTDATPFGIRAELAHSVLDAFYTVMWDKADALHRRIKFVLLKGPNNPKGFVMVKTPGYCNAQLLAPMISPELCDKQMGIYHGDAAVLLRTEIAGVLLANTPEEKNAVVRKANELASTALSTVLESHEEPVYTVSFEGF